jgi:hypothetical protein
MYRTTTGGLLMLLLLLFMACKREGPMGPEGAQGPDGEDATGSGGGGTGGSNLMNFHTPANARFKWEGLDGWHGYEVYKLDITNGSLKLPDKVKGAIDSGFALVYLVGIENDYYRLPLVTDINKQQIYDYSFVGKELTIMAKTKDAANGASTEPSYYNLKGIKIVMAPPTEVHTLKLTD